MKRVREASIKTGTIIVVLDSIGIVTGINTRPKNKYEYSTKGNHRGYICSLEDIRAILGQGDIEAWTRCAGTPVHKVRCCESKALFGLLKDVEPGTNIQVRGRNGIEVVVYNGLSYTRPKYPVSFERNGRKFKGPLSIVVAVERDGGYMPVKHD